MVLTRSGRWGVVVTGVAVLAALPGLVGALPVPRGHVPVPALLARVRASASVGWSGYGESRGALQVPDVRELGGLPALFGDVTRTRTWWRGRHAYRVDALSTAGERDVAVDRRGSWTWVSDESTAVRVEGTPAVRLPQPADLVAPVLGRRLAGTADVAATALRPRRVAGVAAEGVRLSPRHPASTTVAHVDLWADPRTGLVLRVEVLGHGSTAPSLTSVLLDLSRKAPSVAHASYRPGPGFATAAQDAPDVAAAVDRFSPYALPARLVGLPRTGAVRGLAQGGVATYGAGLGAFTVLPLPGGASRGLQRTLEPLGGRVATPLVNVLLAQADGRDYLLAGTVPPGLLDRAAAALRAHPPPLRNP